MELVERHRQRFRHISRFRGHRRTSPPPHSQVTFYLGRSCSCLASVYLHITGKCSSSVHCVLEAFGPSWGPLYSKNLALTLSIQTANLTFSPFIEGHGGEGNASLQTVQENTTANPGPRAQGLFHTANSASLDAMFSG